LFNWLNIKENLFVSRQQQIDRLIHKLNAPKWKFWISGTAKANVARALGEIGPEAIPRLVEAFSGPGAAYAVLALEEIGSEAIPACIKALRSPGAAYAVLFLEKMGESCVEELINEFKTEGAAYASLALRNIGPAALPYLIRAVKNHDSTVRMWAAITLGEMGKWAAEAIPVLQAALTDSDNNVRQAAQEAIEKIE
jgi:HEAT repeat protein